METCSDLAPRACRLDGAQFGPICVRPQQWDGGKQREWTGPGKQLEWGLSEEQGKEADCRAGERKPGVGSGRTWGPAKNRTGAPRLPWSELLLLWLTPSCRGSWQASDNTAGNHPPYLGQVT